MNAGILTGLTIQFSFNGKIFNAITNQEGKASYLYTPTASENTISVYARYLGGSTVKAVQSATRSASKSVSCTPTPTPTPTPTKKATDIYITSDQNFRAGQSYPARAALAQFSGPISGAAVTFYINGVAFSAVTDAGGIAIYNFSTRTTDTVLNIYATYGGNTILLASTSATKSVNKLP